MVLQAVILIYFCNMIINIDGACILYLIESSDPTPNIKFNTIHDLIDPFFLIFKTNFLTILSI